LPQPYWKKVLGAALGLAEWRLQPPVAWAAPFFKVAM
jgi:hypothetical protein